PVKRYVLDASALMAFFERRAGADQVEDLLQRAAHAQRPLLLSVLNWGEVYYSVWRTQGEAAANQKLVEIAQLPIELVDVDMETTKLAATLKAQYKL
ncbi:PIN domain-containing protein, partial [Acidobacteriia bacterium AH_259_A11_L15]|nr:PIN domain-containing protein [Acidobacteriia bacterium AH_259_A11_L15]